jgi:hypothetical protein
LPFLRNGLSTPVTLETSTNANNRPLPVSLFAGDGLGNLAIGSGVLTSETLRVGINTSQFSLLATDAKLVNIVNLLTPMQTDLASVNTKIPAQISGRLPVDLPSTAATAALQTTANTLLTNGNTQTSLIASATAQIEAKTPTLISGRQPVDIASLPLPAGAATSALQNSTITLLTSGNTNTSSVATSVALIESKTPALVSGRQPVDGSGVTQPVSAVSLPLPTGAATEARQISENLSIASLDSKSPALVGGRVPVDGSGVTQPVSAVSLPLPTGAATAANQSTMITTLNLSKTKGKTIPTTTFVNYGAASVTTGAWTQLVASVSANVEEIQIFDSSGQTLEIGIGAAASEARLFLVPPGGTTVQAKILSGARVSIRAVSGLANSGNLVINYIGEN